MREDWMHDVTSMNVTYSRSNVKETFNELLLL